MRTVTFSNPEVADVVNGHFVSAWVNRSPGFTNSDYRTEEAIFKQSAVAYPTKNICTFVTTPEGKVFTYVAGYLSPELFLKFVKSAIMIRECAFDRQMKLRVGGLEVVRRLHQDRSDEFTRSVKAPEVSCGFAERRYREVKHAHGKQWAWVGQTAFAYLARLHKHWGDVKALPDLADVRYKYLYGNLFSEEGAGASRIERDPAIVVLRR